MTTRARAEPKLSQGQELPFYLLLGAGAQRLGPFSTVFLDLKQGAGSEAEQLGRNPIPMWDANIAGRGLDCHTTASALDH